jgi:hypothetical protein
VCTYACISTTTIRLTQAQKRKLREAQAILHKGSTRKISQRETVRALAEFAIRNRVLFTKDSDEPSPDLQNDPFYNLSIVFDFGPTDTRGHDRVLYGNRGERT